MVNEIHIFACDSQIQLPGDILVTDRVGLVIESLFLVQSFLPWVHFYLRYYLTTSVKL